MAKRQAAGRRVAKPNLTMARLTALESVAFTALRLLSGERLISPRAHYLRLFIWRTIPAQIWPRRRLREINKSSARGGCFCMCVCVCVTAADGSGSGGKTVHDFRTFPR